MTINSMKDVDVLFDTVGKCKRDVHLRSIYGDNFNLKSQLSMYVAIGALLSNHGDELEIFCDSKDDEHWFLEMFENNPNMR